MRIEGCCRRCGCWVEAWIDPDDVDGEEHVKCTDYGTNLIMHWNLSVNVLVEINDSKNIDPNQQALPLQERSQ